ncbi:LCP family protein [Bounagaea algeriensis]
MSDWSARPPSRGRGARGGGSYDYYAGRQQQRRPQSPPQDQRRPSSPPPQGRQPRGGRKRRWPRRLGVVVLVLLLALGGLLVYVDSQLQRTEALDFSGNAADSAGTNWLLVGSDSREGLDESQRDELSAGDAGGRRTDTMMLLHVPAGGGQPALISLPRDSYVQVPGHGWDKLNASFSYGGPQLLSQTVEGATGVHIDRYAEIGFGGFADLVDAVGGVNMHLDEPLNDDRANVHLPAGQVHLDGPTALGFVRARYGLEGGDMERAENQRKLLGALVDKATSPAVLLNPYRAWQLASKGPQTFLVDNGAHVWHLMFLARSMGQVSSGDGVTTSVPFGEFETTPEGQSVVRWDSADAKRMFQAVANDEPIPQDLLGQ